MGVAQTSDGYIWLATEEGLVRYDGLTFRTFDEQNSPGLPDRLIRSLAASSDGSLWIGTRTGLARYQNGVFSSFAKQTQVSSDIYDLCVSRDGSIWFSSDHGIHRFRDGKSIVYTTADGLPDDRITTIAQGADGSIWAGTRAGLVRFANGRFTTYVRDNETLANSINALAVSANGTVWIGTTSGEIDRWSAGRISVWWRDPHRRAQIQCMREDREGTLWVAFERLGLARMHGRNLELFTKADGLPSNDPDWMYEDREKELWIGWADAGASTLRESKFTSFGEREGLSSDHTSSVLQARDGTLWVGTEDRGLNHIRNGRVETYSERQGLRGNDFVSLLVTRDGAIWSGSDKGFLSRIKDGRISIYGKQQSVPPRISALLEDHSGQLWVGFEEQDGLSRFLNGRFEHVHLAGRVKALAEAPNGGLWIATYGNGVSRLQNGTVLTYTEKQGLSSNKAMSIYVDGEGTVWAGTAQAGLNRIKNARITKYSVQQGLFDSTVGAIVEDDYGYLWLTSTRGISRVKKQELDDFADGKTDFVHSTSYGEADGLRSAECSIGAQPAAWKAQDGTLWFATTRGLASIDPNRLRNDDVPPAVNLDGISYGGQPVRSGTAELKSGSGRLEFNFTAPSFISTLHERARYRLDGYDANWVEALTRRSATYTNLSPGNYAFRVQAANADGVWNPKEAVYRFRLLPRFYQTTWFRMLAALGILLTTWRVYLIRVRYLTDRNQALEQKVQSRTAELLKAVQAAEIARELLREQATKDALTGLWNRRAIFDILESEMVRCAQNCGRLCVLMVDLDHFKAINDRFGHLAGDQVLQQAALRLRRGLRENEAVGRYGGEELMIVFPDCSLATALQRAEDLRAIIEHPRVLTDAGEMWVTCSIGAASLDPGGTGRDLIGAADAALYEAKAAGRNCVRTCKLFDPAISERVLTF